MHASMAFWRLCWQMRTPWPEERLESELEACLGWQFGNISLIVVRRISGVARSQFAGS